MFREDDNGLVNVSKFVVFVFRVKGSVRVRIVYR